MTSNVFEEMDYREGFAGGCYLNGTAICVAKPEKYCDDETFVPAHYLRSNSGHPLRYCAGRLEDVIIGRCGGINGKCSNLQSRCNSDNNSSNGKNEGIIGNNSTSTEEEEDQNSSSFIEYDPTCTITQDLSSTSSSFTSLTSLSYVTYGKCGDRCVWSSDDCINDEIYIPNGNNTECTADKVQIGACFGGHAFCAVDSSSCTQPNRPDEPYWTHQEVQEKIGANCFLSSLPVPTPAPVVSAPAPAQSPSTVTNTTTTTTNTAFGGEENLLSSSGNNNNNNNGLNTGALVAIVTVIAIVVGIAIGVIGTVRFSSKRKNSNNSNNNTEQPPPTIPIEDIEIMSSPNNHNNNNNTMDDVDAHSELSEDNNDSIIN